MPFDPLVPIVGNWAPQAKILVLWNPEAPSLGS